MLILPQERALLYYRGLYKKLLMPGKHWIPPFHTVEKYLCKEMTFTPRSTPLEILLQDSALAEALELIEVPDTHIAVYRENGLVTGCLTPGRYAFWKDLTKREFSLIDLNLPESADKEDRAVLYHPAVQSYLISHTIEAYEQGLLCINKAFVRVLESGVYHFWKCGAQQIDVLRVDLRGQQLEITGQEIMTRDKVPLRMNFFCQYRITDGKCALIENKGFEEQFRVLLQVALREYIGALSFDEVMEKKDTIGERITAVITDKAALLGVKTGVAGIKDIILPGEIRDIINQVLIAEKQAQANVITRREETASTRSLLNTAKLMEENAVLFRLKELEYIERIAEKINQITLSGSGQILDQLKSLFTPSTESNG